MAAKKKAPAKKAAGKKAKAAKKTGATKTTAGKASLGKVKAIPALTRSKALAKSAASKQAQHKTFVQVPDGSVLEVELNADGPGVVSAVEVRISGTPVALWPDLHLDDELATLELKSPNRYLVLVDVGFIGSTDVNVTGTVTVGGVPFPVTFQGKKPHSDRAVASIFMA